MMFQIREAAGRVSDAVKRNVPGWKTRSNSNPITTITELEKRAEQGIQLDTLLAHPGWSIIKEYITNRKDQIQGVLEGAVLTQDKALELAQVQGRIRELKMFEDWLETRRKRGTDAAREIAERKRG